MDFSSICRTCLGTKYLEQIFLESKNNSLAIFTATGIKISPDDGLPQQICTECINFIGEIQKFQSNCKVNEETLLEIKLKQYGRNIEENSFIKVENIFGDKTESESIKLDDEIRINSVQSNELKLSDIEDDKPLKYYVTEKECTNEAKIFYVIHENEDINKDEDDHCSNKNEIEYEDENHSKQDDVIKDEDDNSSKNKTNSKHKHRIKNDNIKEKIDTVSNSKRLDKDRLKFNKEGKEDIFQIEVPYEVDLTSDPELGRVKCKLCWKSLSIRSIDAHMASRHPGKDQRKVKCDLCDRYVLKSRMNRHKKIAHNATSQKSEHYKCGYCKADFIDKDSLVRHVPDCGFKKKKRKTNESNRELQECDVCHKMMQKASIKTHKAVKHAGLRPVCEHCGKSFGNKFRLTEHYRAKHGYEKFHCSYCEFKTAGLLSLKNHERRHLGDKPFVCETCGAKFHAAYLLAQHKQSHRTERTIKCELCPATFKANNSLHMHKITCHSKCMYKCCMCDRTYSCRHYVVKHLRHFHEFRGIVPKLTKIEVDKSACLNEEI